MKWRRKLATDSERTLVGCANPPSAPTPLLRAVGAPYQCPRINQNPKGMRHVCFVCLFVYMNVTYRGMYPSNVLTIPSNSRAPKVALPTLACLLAADHPIHSE